MGPSVLDGTVMGGRVRGVEMAAMLPAGNSMASCSLPSCLRVLVTVLLSCECSTSGASL